MTETYVALLRGVNVGGNNKLPMKDLAALFADCGCLNVRTFIQSGNVIFRSQEVEPLPDLVAGKIADRFGFRAPVIVRSKAEMERAVGKNPYLGRAHEDFLYVMFLASEPGTAEIGSLDPSRSPPDEFTVAGKDVYLMLLNGAGKTKLTNGYFDSKLKTVSTIRNWRTVNKLLELMDS